MSEAWADENHIFVKCTGGSALKTDYLGRITNAIAKFENVIQPLEEHDKDEAIALIPKILVNDPVWKTGLSTYWKGALPIFLTYNPRLARLYNEITDLQSQSAGRIWQISEAKRKAMERQTAQNPEQQH